MKRQIILSFSFIFLFYFATSQEYSRVIDWNGDVFLCPQDWQRRKAMGNIAKSTGCKTRVFLELF